MSNVTINTTLCYLRQNKKTLMLHRGKQENDPLHGKWIVPGGKLEPGESPIECVLREFREETGLTLNEIKWRGIITFVIETPKNFLETCHAFIFESTTFGGEMIDSPEGYLEWVDDHKIHKLDIFDKDKILLSWIYKNDKFFSGKFYSVGKKLKSHDVNFF